RHGLGLGRPAADGKPRYVLSITPVDNTVTVGPREALDVHVVHAERPVWLDGETRPGPIECQVQLRAHGEVHDATVTCDDSGITARLREPAKGVAAGQALVVYRPDADGDIVLASATIARTEALVNA
ncbi:MAG: aminomethyltransferase beta-barrel domain-containing protein, partial [Stackebrandtia sp.]